MSLKHIRFEIRTREGTTICVHQHIAPENRSGRNTHLGRLGHDIRSKLHFDPPFRRTSKGDIKEDDRVLAHR
jgi:hypothetical protein